MIIEYLAPRTRLEDIEADLMAYRLGWIGFDSRHIRELQAERAAILKSNAEKAK